MEQKLNCWVTNFKKQRRYVLPAKNIYVKDITYFRNALSKPQRTVSIATSQKQVIRAATLISVFCFLCQALQTLQLPFFMKILKSS